MSFVKKVGVIYRIEPDGMYIVDEYKKVSDITSDVGIYRVLNGEKWLYKDGYLYRRSRDIDIIDAELGVIVDQLTVESKDDKVRKKYDEVIKLLEYSDYSIPEIVRICRNEGIKVSEATCRKLKKEYCS